MIAEVTETHHITICGKANRVWEKKQKNKAHRDIVCDWKKTCDEKQNREIQSFCFR